jgi:hypothetical protein
MRCSIAVQTLLSENDEEVCGCDRTDPFEKLDSGSMIHASHKSDVNFNSTLEMIGDEPWRLGLPILLILRHHDKEVACGSM